MVPIRETKRSVPLPDVEPVLVIARSVRKKVLLAPCRTPATGTTMASLPTYPYCRDQSTMLQLSPLRLSTGVAYARNPPVLPELVKMAATVPEGAALLICDRPNGPTVSLRVPRVPPEALRNSVCTVTPTPAVSWMKKLVCAPESWRMPVSTNRAPGATARSDLNVGIAVP